MTRLVRILEDRSSGSVQRRRVPHRRSLFSIVSKEPVYAPYVEHMPPDTTAAIFWMKNRDPAHWRDAWQIEHSLGKYIISDKPMTQEQWIKERAVMLDAEATEVIEDKTE
jgi:hypothetical protein